jgi:hypothetical protein
VELPDVVDPAWPAAATGINATIAATVNKTLKHLLAFMCNLPLRVRAFDITQVVSFRHEREEVISNDPGCRH